MTWLASTFRRHSLANKLRAGDRLGPYRLLRRVGSGGMGVVFAALHVRIGRQVALKILHPYLSHDEEMVTRLLREAHASNLVRHPGVVQITDHHRQSDGTTYLVMEFLDGETLRRRIRSSTPLGAAEVLGIAGQLAAALAAAHAQGVVHRDLKPENIMLLEGGARVKILDFGLARAASSEDHLTLDGRRLGTPAYMAPEQCTGERATSASDVYALGAVLYELCAGRPPFVSEDQGALYSMQRYEEPPYLAELAPGTSAPLVRLVHELLSKSPAARPSMSEVCESLRALGAPIPDCEEAERAEGGGEAHGTAGTPVSLADSHGTAGTPVSLADSRGLAWSARSQAAGTPAWRWAAGALATGLVIGGGLWMIRNDVTIAHHLHYRMVSRSMHGALREQASGSDAIAQLPKPDIRCVWFQRFQGGKIFYTVSGISGLPAGPYGRTFFVLSTENTAQGLRWSMLQQTNYQALRDLDLFGRAVAQGRAELPDLGLPRRFTPLADIENYFRGYNGFGDIDKPAVAGSIARLYALQALDSVLGRPQAQECASTILIQRQPHRIVIGGAPISLCQETEAIYVLNIESEGATTAQGRWEEIDRQPLFGDRFHRNCIPPAVDVSLGLFAIQRRWTKDVFAVS